MPIIVLGRSLGSACAIHLATAPNVCGLIIESGVMELLKLPMVMQFAMMMPQLPGFPSVGSWFTLFCNPPPKESEQRARKVTNLPDPE